MFLNLIKKVDYKKFIFSIIIIAYAFIVSKDNISNGFWYDDFHLIRNFSNSELISVWHGPYDTDHFETLGYRPLYVYFNDMRYLFFGENVVASGFSWSCYSH